MSNAMAWRSRRWTALVAAAVRVAMVLVATMWLGLAAPESALACNYGNNGEVAGGCGNVTPPPPPNPGCNGGQCCSGNCCENDCCPPSGGGGPGGSSSGGGAGGGGASRGKPVALFSGSENMAIADMEVKGIYSIQLVRWYSSDSKYDSPLGYGWAFNLDKRLYKYADNSVIIRSGCGIRTKYLYAGGVYQSQNKGKQPTLIEKSDGSFELTTSSGQRETFDAQGRLTVKQDTLGNRIEFTYDSRGRLPLIGSSPFSLKPAEPMVVAYDYRLTKIEERLSDGALTGQSVTFTYNDANGRLQKISANDGREVNYQHDLTISAKNGNLLRVDGLADVDSIYEYNDPADAHNATSIRHGSTTDAPYINEYYADTGKVKRQTFGADSYEFAYSPLKTTATHKIYTATGALAASETTTYSFNGDGFPLTIEWVLSTGAKYKKILTRNSASALVESETLSEWPVGASAYTDTGTTQYQYDTAGYKTQEQVALASGEVITKNWSYLQGKLTSEQVQSSADPNKLFRTEYTYYADGSGKPTNIKEKKRRKEDGSFVVTQYTYSSGGQLLTTIQPDGIVIRNVYQGDKVIRTETMDGATVLPHQQLSFSYDSRGNLQTVTDANSHATTLTYDDRQRLAKLTNALGEETHYRYTDKRLTEVESGSTPNDGEGQVTQHTYTAQGQLQSVRHKNDNGGWVASASYTYLSDGNRQTAVTYRDGNAYTTTYSYDGLARLISVTDPMNNITRYTYDALGNRTSIIDAKSRVTTYTYDALNRLVQVEQKGVTPSAVTTFSYDAAGNLLSVRDPEGRITTYEYDALSRRTAVVQPLGQRASYQYDDLGRLTATINARGQKVAYTYANWGGLDRVDYYDNGSAATSIKRVQYSYDLVGNLTGVSDNTIASTPLYQWTYDALNRINSITIGYLPMAATLNNAYDRYGNRSQLVLQDGVSAISQFSYNRLNQLSAITFPGGQTISPTYSVDAGMIKQLVYSSGASTTYQYNANNLVDLLTHTGNATIDQLAYSYDAMLNITSVASTMDGGTHTYGYDGLDRLISATRPANYAVDDEAYDYDKVGNRDHPGGVNTYGYDGNHRITESPGATYGYDEDGNLTSRSDGATFAFDADNRLIAFSRGATAASYRYDPFGRRISKTVDGATTYYLWDQSQLLAEYGVSGRLVRYSYLPGSMNPVQFEDSSGIYTVHNDHLQTARAVTNGSEQVVWSARQEAFGSVVVDADPDGNGDSITYNPRFPGQYYDVESGLHYNYHRFYDPGIGRYITSDPIGLTADINTYSYVSAKPLKYFDPLGLYSEWCIPWFSKRGEWTNVGSKQYGQEAGMSHTMMHVAFCRYARTWTQDQQRTVTAQEKCYVCDCYAGVEKCDFETRQSANGVVETRANSGTERAGNIGIIFTKYGEPDTVSCKSPWSGITYVGPYSGSNESSLGGPDGLSVH